MNVVTEATVDDFMPGDEVRYHPRGDGDAAASDDWQTGIVDSVGRLFVFVTFDGKRQPVACEARHLQRVDE